MSSSHSDDLKNGLKWSLIAHFALGVIFFIHYIVFPDRSVRYAPTLRVDLVGLPDILKKNLVHIPKKTLLPQPTAQPAEAKQKTDAPKSNEMIAKDSSEKTSPDKASPDKTSMENGIGTKKLTRKALENQNRNAMARIKALAKMQEAVEESSKKQKFEAKTEAGVEVKGNRISGGSSLSGEAKEALHDNYYDLVKEHLHENFKLNPWLQSRANLTARVKIFFDSKGKVRQYHFDKVSGNAQFDEAVKRAIQESQPFPFPPKELEAKILANGIPFGFPL